MKIKKLICGIAVLASLLAVSLPSVIAKGITAETITKHSYDSDMPFFNDYMNNVYSLDNNASLDYWFDQLPRTTKKDNFCSLDTVEYSNINGKTVTVDTFYRNVGDSLNDPNFGQGILLYQAIQYKVAHPEKDVEIYFSSYRMSSTAGVCVDPNSKFYGYMRSLFDSEYDNFGFIRISFMLVEAARMGIKVVIVPQLNSYAVNQYSETAAKHYAKRDIVDYHKYFDQSLNRACYSSYENGKVVSDFLQTSYNEWNVEERGMDMQHLKSLIVSNYRDRFGVDHDYGVFLESANLDENDYKGRNGNTGAQSGVIITNHEKIYNCTKNYINLIAKYRNVNGIVKFREIVSNTQTEQIDAFYNGTYNLIPNDEILCYPGSSRDDVFELYFTPLAGNSGIWDKKYMPYSKYLTEMYNSRDYIVFTWNMPYDAVSNSFEYTVEDVICETFHKNRNPKNRIYMHFEAFDANKYNDLVIGKDLEYKNINQNLSTYIHSKDILMSYEHEGQRKYVSIISSCNFGNHAFWYRSNSVLVVKENENAHYVYSSIGAVSTSNCITSERKGLSLRNIEDRYSLTNTFTDFPKTFEAVVDCNADLSNKKGCTIIGNYTDKYVAGVSFRIYLDGRPSLCLRYDRDHQDQFYFPSSIIGQGIVKLAISIDSTYVYGYLDGVQVLKKKHCGYMPELGDVPFSVGGDNRDDNSWWFRNGKIYSLNVFKNSRSMEKINDDFENLDIKNDYLLAAFDFAKSKKDLSKNHNDLYSYYFEKDFIPSNEYDFTIAAVGDIQSMSNNHANETKAMFNWLKDNKESKKIERVITLGDLTNDCTDEQWQTVADSISVLDGEIPYSLIRGNHDKMTKEEVEKARAGEPAVISTKFNEYFDNDVYSVQYTGAYNNDPVNTYFATEICGIKYLFINLDFGPSTAVLNWAGDICETYSDYNAIISTHCFMFRDGTFLDKDDLFPPTYDGYENDGDDIFDKFISKHENISLVLCGHDPISDVKYAEFEGKNGSVVSSLLTDHQYIDKFVGPSGMLTLLHFSNNGKKVQVETYSTVEERFYKHNNQFEFELNVI